MTEIRKYLNTDKKDEIISGEVIKRVGNNLYNVKTGSVVVPCRSFDDIRIGSHVLYTKSESSYAILQSNGKRNTNIVQVTVNG